ncbi:hypothetical protein [Noviherbaspirillum sp. UKPF54]|uniref:hypothetical protein n=1 Tax=Noviherbaspirillum sp. UKPF54 TaxID=2601898 RepID=UPI0011B152C7|nr:hypothetical protein [Noviherbaspirillum sp. UKPF54]QDZ29624.1 hypothetical protein FAY22_17640 [Noviherbaspirillum sp. UKPF54]
MEKSLWRKAWRTIRRHPVEEKWCTAPDTFPHAVRMAATPICCAGVRRPSKLRRQPFEYPRRAKTRCKAIIAQASIRNPVQLADAWRAAAACIARGHLQAALVKLRHAAIHVVLSLLLLLSQQLAMAHAVSHLSSDNASGMARQKQLPPELQCDQCLAFAAIGSAVNAPPHDFVIGQSVNLHDALAAPCPLLASPQRVFDSRAPPVVVR